MEQPAIVCRCRLEFFLVLCRDVHVWRNDDDNSVVDESISELNDRALPSSDDATTENGGCPAAWNGNATRRNGTDESVPSPGCRYGNGRNAEPDGAYEPGFDDGAPPLHGDGPRAHGYDAAGQHAPRADGNATGALYEIQHYAHAAPDEGAYGTSSYSSGTSDNGWGYASSHGSHDSPPCGHALADGARSDDAPGSYHDERGLPPTTEQHDGSTAWCSASSPAPSPRRHHAHRRPASDADGGTTNPSAGTARTTDVVASATAAAHAKPASSTTAAKDSANEHQCIANFPTAAAAS